MERNEERLQTATERLEEASKAADESERSVLRNTSRGFLVASFSKRGVCGDRKCGLRVVIYIQCNECMETYVFILGEGWGVGGGRVGILGGLIL